MIIIESKRKKLETLRAKYPGAEIIDVTSKGVEPFVQLSPLYPHGRIPVPFSPGWTAYSVEGIWQGLKVFEKCDIDTTLFEKRGMRGLKRSVQKYGNVRGHCRGVNGSRWRLLDYVRARKEIYAPTYLWVLENKTNAVVERLKELSEAKTVVLLDYNTNAEIENPSRPLSNAALVKAYIEGTYPIYEEEYVASDDKECLSRFSVGQWVVHEQYGAGQITELNGFRAVVAYGKRSDEFDLHSGMWMPLDPSKDFWLGALGFKRRPGLEELMVVACSDKTAVKMVIPATFRVNGKDYPVTEIGPKVFSGCRRLRSVSIPRGVISIAPDAFLGCDDLAEVRRMSSGRETVQLVMNDEGCWGVIENPAKRVAAIPCRYEEIRFYVGKLVAQQRIPTYYFLVKEKGAWGLLNKVGHQQAPCIYDDLTPKETGGLLQGFSFRRGGLTGIIDGNGEETLD